MKLKSAALSGGLWIILQQKLLGYASLKMHNGELLSDCNRTQETT